MRRTVGAMAMFAAVVVAARLVYGAPRLGYDETWAVLWGAQLAHGGLPELTAPLAPTPHPLTIALGAVLAPLGFRALAVYAWLGPLSLAALGAAALATGTALFGRRAGIVAALILLTSPWLVGEALYASLDLPFLALTLAAVGRTVRAGRPTRSALALLALAGLLRPEAWLLAFAVAAWWLVRDRRLPAGALLLALIAPALWALMDLLCTGDPLHSLHGTRALAATLERPRDPFVALALVPHGLASLLGGSAVIAGLAGGIALVWRSPGRAAVPLAAAGIGLAAFVGLGLASLPVLTRYLLLPAAILALLAGYAVSKWDRRGPAALAVALLALLAITAPGTARDLRATRTSAAATRQVRAELVALARSPASRREGCGPLLLSGYRPVPLLRLATGAGPGDIRVAEGPSPRIGRALTPASSAATAATTLAGTGAGPAVGTGFTAVARNRSWVMLERCV